MPYYRFFLCFYQYGWSKHIKNRNFYRKLVEKKEDRLHFFVKNQKSLLNEWRGADNYSIAIHAILFWYFADRTILWVELQPNFWDNVEILAITNTKWIDNRPINKLDTISKLSLIILDYNNSSWLTYGKKMITIYKKWIRGLNYKNVYHLSSCTQFRNSRALLISKTTFSKLS